MGEHFHYTARKGYPYFEQLKSVFANMINRVSKETSYLWKDIKVCSAWTDKYFGFVRFYDWAVTHGYSYKVIRVAGKYQNHLTLDRIDCMGDYSPSNCRWVSWQEQWNNRLGIVMTPKQREFYFNKIRLGLPCSYKDYERETGEKVFGTRIGGLNEIRRKN